MTGLRRIDREQQHLQDHDAAVIVVEHVLHKRLAGGLDELAVGGEDLLDLRLADDFAHGALGHGLHGRRADWRR